MKILQQVSFAKDLLAYSFIRAGEMILVKGSTYRLSSRIDAVLELRRHQISNDITRSLKRTVTYGNFKGMKFASDSIWGASDSANMLLGLYEREISDLLIFLAEFEKRNLLIDCGAADGYFAIGALVSGKFNSVWAFEQSEQQSRSLNKNAQINNLQSQLKILGSAEVNFLDNLEMDETFRFERSIFLLDIEGGEYKILNESNLWRMKDSICIVELHDFTDDQRLNRISMLARARKSHNGFLITTGARDLSEIHELDHLSDSNRWLVCSEGRPRVMDWLVLFPKAMKNRLLDIGISHRAI